jgi:uncharacterized protein YjdB
MPSPRVRRNVRLAILVAVCAMASGCPNACDEISKLVNPTGTSVQSVTISPLSAQIAVGSTVQFTATVLPTGVSDRSVTWSVAPTGIATIDTNGVLTGVAAGQVVVTAVSVSTPVHSAQAAAVVVASAQ